MTADMVDKTRATLLDPDKAKLLPLAALLDAALTAFQASNCHREIADVIRNTGEAVKRIACEKIDGLGDEAESEALHVFDLAAELDAAVRKATVHLRETDVATAEYVDIQPLRDAAHALLAYMGVDQVDASR